MNIDEHHSTYLTPSISHLKSFLHLVCCLYFVERETEQAHHHSLMPTKENEGGSSKVSKLLHFCPILVIA